MGTRGDWQVLSHCFVVESTNVLGKEVFKLSNKKKFLLGGFWGVSSVRSNVFFWFFLGVGAFSADSEM